MKFRKLAYLLENQRLVLASGSPRRVFLLSEAGVRFRQLIPDIHEDNNLHTMPYRLATILAEKKAEAVLDRLENDEIALGCDTIVVLDGKILGKPTSPEDAVRMLKLMSGRMHVVCSAVALLDRDERMASGYELTDVYFNSVTEEQIVDYVKTGEPLDKAGSYGIQERGVFLVDRIEGNIDNVIGLPLMLLDDIAGKLAEIKGFYGI
ncbi:MAG: nucleoside triphosphate pyrophosphatase [Candidatus Zixiibacteriota bacterium]